MEDESKDLQAKEESVEPIVEASQIVPVEPPALVEKVAEVP